MERLRRTMVTLLGVAGLLWLSGATLADDNCICPPCPLRPNCNMVISETVLPPDNPLEVFVSLRSIDACTGTVAHECQASFQEPQGEFLTEEEKCKLLAASILNDPACHCYEVEETCDIDRKFKVTDPCPCVTTELGISNDKLIFTQTGQGQALPDYEAEIIEITCADPTPSHPSSGDEIVSHLTLGGVANGIPIVENEPSHVEAIAFFDVFFDVELGPDAPVEVEAEVQTFPGQTAEEVAQELAEKLSAAMCSAGLPGVAEVLSENQGPGRTIRVRGLGLRGAGIGTSDEGITTANHAGPANALPIAPPPIFCEASPAPQCGGSCPIGEVCVDIGAGCQCQPPEIPCSASPFPVCNGFCKFPGETCEPNPAGGACECQFGRLTCQQSGPPLCGGTCPEPFEFCLDVGAGCDCIPFLGSDAADVGPERQPAEGVGNQRIE